MQVAIHGSKKVTKATNISEYTNVPKCNLINMLIMYCVLKDMLCMVIVS